MPLKVYGLLEIQVPGRYVIVREEAVQNYEIVPLLSVSEPIQGDEIWPNEAESAESDVVEGETTKQFATVQEVLRSFRESRKLSLKKLAQETGLHRGHLSKQERADGPKIQNRTITALSNFYGPEFLAAINLVMKRDHD